MDSQKTIPRWKVWEGILAIIVIVIIMMVFGFLVEIWTKSWEVNEMLVVFGTSLVQTALMLGGSWYIVVVKHGHSFRDLGFLPKSILNAVPKGIKWGIGLFMLVMVLGILEAVIYPVQPEAQDFAKILLLAKSKGEFFLAIIMGVILAPLGEEIYFRGLLFTAMRHKWGASKAIIFTGFIFAGMHFDLYRLIPIAAGGIGLTYLYHKTGNIWTNILAHGVWNAIMIGLIFIYPVSG